jgi:hypothetical protein
VIGVLADALETKVRPAVMIASSTYLVEDPDVLVGILTTKARVPCIIPRVECLKGQFSTAYSRISTALHAAWLRILLSAQD